MNNKFIYFSLLVFHFSLAFGQTNMTLDRDLLLPYQADLNSVNSKAFTSVMPYDKEKTNTPNPLLGAKGAGDSVPMYKDMIFKNNSDLIHSGAFSCNIFPLADAGTGYDLYG